MLSMAKKSKTSKKTRSTTAPTDKKQSSRKRVLRGKDKDALLARHHELVDKKYGVGLKPEEVIELADLGRRLDDLVAPFYDPIISRAESMLAARKGRRPAK